MSAVTGNTSNASNYIKLAVDFSEEKVGKETTNAAITFSIVASVAYVAFKAASFLATPVILVGAAAIAATAYFPERKEVAFVFNRVVETANMLGTDSLNFLSGRVSLPKSA